MKLAVETKQTHYINWLTYSHMQESGLGRFLAQVSKCERFEVDLLESPNDTDFKVEVSANDIRDDGSYMQHEHKETTEQINSGEIEHYCMHNIFCWLLHNGYIEPGNYVVTMSW